MLTLLRFYMQDATIAAKIRHLKDEIAGIERAIREHRKIKRPGYPARKIGRLEVSRRGEGLDCMADASLELGPLRGFIVADQRDEARDSIS